MIVRSVRSSPAGAVWRRAVRTAEIKRLLTLDGVRLRYEQPTH